MDLEENKRKRERNVPIESQESWYNHIFRTIARENLPKTAFTRPTSSLVYPLT